jgi:hypothetical protein
MWNEKSSLEMKIRTGLHYGKRTKDAKPLIPIGNRALAMSLMWLAIAFCVIGVVALLYFLMYGRYFDIHFIVKSNEAKRHVINMGQVLLSSHKLVYEETFDDGSKRFYRGVFDKDKLDQQLVNNAGFLAGLLGTKGGELREEVSYPKTATRIIVELINCLNSNVDNAFWAVVRHYTPWKDWDAEECYSAYADKLGVYNQEFPVLIYDDGDLHAGRLYLRVMEDYVAV